MSETKVKDCIKGWMRNPDIEGPHNMRPVYCSEAWHVASHADSDSLFRHSGALIDCRECNVFPITKETDNE